MSKKKTAVPDTTSTVQLSNEQLVRAALNLPSDEFELGGRRFKVVDLGYDDYLEFLNLLSPFVDIVVGKITGNISVPGIDLDVNNMNSASFIALIGNKLPELATIVCRQTEPSITVEEVKALARKPTALIPPVIKQVTQNGMVKDFTDFFGQVTGILKVVR
jgi:hypothetical protein